MVAVTRYPWKLVAAFDPKDTPPTAAVTLHDLRQPAPDAVNLASDHPEVTRALLALVADKLAEAQR